MRIVLSGPPGAGKGTQAKAIGARWTVPEISTGEIFSDQVARDTALGRRAKEYINDGQLVPDDITIAMVRDRLAAPDARAGFLLDGFPRTTGQGVALDSMLAELGTSVNVVLLLELSDGEVQQRLAGRRVCRDCGKTWHIAFDPPTLTDRCDVCGGALFIRDDDVPEVIQERLRVYARDTAPLIDYYGAQGKLVTIDASGPVAEVTARVLAAL